MRKKIIAVFMMIMFMFGSMAIYATSGNSMNKQADLTGDSTVSLVKIKIRN